MSKAILMSIKPKWVELIANGKKTVEVRKTVPKIDVPFKCYIYCTKSRTPYESFGVNKQPIECGGKVIGEFVCDRIDEFVNLVPIYTLVQSCLTAEQIREYLKGKNGYGWHISNLVIYDKPKELWNFKKECVGYVRNDEDCCFETCPEFDLGGCDGRYKPIYTPPMSWCYVEDLGV